MASVNSSAYDTLLSLLQKEREAAGISQRELSHRLGRPHNYIVKIERGVRRLDVIELIEICRELRTDLDEFFGKLLDLVT